MIAGEFQQQRIQIISATHLAAGSLEVEETHDHFADVRVERQPSAWPRISEVRKIPARCDEPIKTAAVAEYRLDGVVGQVVSREKPGLTSFLSLPGRSSVGTSAAERRVSVGVFLDADGDWTRFLHSQYLMKLFALLQHVYAGLDPFLSRLRFLGRLDSPEDGVGVGAAQRLEESPGFWVSIEPRLKFRIHRR